PLAASLILPGLLSHLARAAPAIQPRVTVNSAQTLLEDLELGRIEFLVCGEHLISSSLPLDREILRVIELVLLVRANHPLAAKRRVTAQDMMGFPLLAGAGNRKSNAPAVIDYTGPVGIVCENYHILKEVMLDSDAVWLSSPELVSREIAEG